MESPDTLPAEIQQLRSTPEDTRGVLRHLAALTAIAKVRPNDLIPYATDIASFLDSAAGGVREASLETLELLSRTAPGTMAFLLPKLHSLLVEEPQNAVADRAISILTNYARSGKRAAESVLPIFASTIDRYGTRNAERVLESLTQLVGKIPELGKSALRIGQKVESSVSQGVRLAVERLRAVVK